jgi:hypothetical protein
MNSRQRSFFWPILLIGVGVVWLLANLGLLEGLQWGTLWRLWPILLIAIGLDLIFGRRSAWVGALVGLVAVAAIIAIVLFRPGLLGTTSVDVKDTHLLETVNGATAAIMDLDLSVGKTSIKAATDPDTLFEANVRHIGDLRYQVSGAAEREIRLRQSETFDFQPFDWIDSARDLRWEISLNPDVPTRLLIEGGVGEETVDLSQIELDALTLEVGVGDVDLILPTSEEPYEVDLKGGVGEVNVEIRPFAHVVLAIEGGVGSLDLELGESSNIQADIKGGVGGVALDIPKGAAVRVEADANLGRVNLPSWMTRAPAGVAGSDWQAWESEGYEDAEMRIFIRYEGGLGGLTIN